MAPDAPLWQIALASGLSVWLGQTWARRRVTRQNWKRDNPEGTFVYRAALWTGRRLRQYRGKRRGEGLPPQGIGNRLSDLRPLR